MHCRMLSKVAKSHRPIPSYTDPVPPSTNSYWPMLTHILKQSLVIWSDLGMFWGQSGVLATFDSIRQCINAPNFYIQLIQGRFPFPFWMTFWKSSKRREGAISDPKILVADLSTSRKKRTTVFGNKGGAGEGVTGRLEVFRKFIQNGTVKRPLIPLHTRTNKRTCESTTKVC